MTEREPYSDGWYDWYPSLRAALEANPPIPREELGLEPEPEPYPTEAELDREYQRHLKEQQT